MMSNNKTELHPLPLTRAWVKDNKRWLREQEAPTAEPADADKQPDLQDFIREHGDWRRLPADYFDAYPEPDRERHWKNVRANGAYSVITPDEWAQWDRRMAAWRARRRGG